MCAVWVASRSGQAQPTSVVKLRRKPVGNFVSKCNLDLSPVLYLAAGGPHSLESICLFSRDAYFPRVMVKRTRGVRLLVQMQNLRGCCIIPLGGIRMVPFLPSAETHAQTCFGLGGWGGGTGEWRSRLWLLNFFYWSSREGGFQDCQGGKMQDSIEWCCNGGSVEKLIKRNLRECFSSAQYTTGLFFFPNLILKFTSGIC